MDDEATSVAGFVMVSGWVQVQTAHTQNLRVLVMLGGDPGVRSGCAVARRLEREMMERRERRRRERREA